MLQRYKMLNQNCGLLKMTGPHGDWKAYRADLMSQKGKRISLSTNQLTTSRQKQKVARLSCPAYCANFAASKQMSLGSCRIITTAPILVYLQEDPVSNTQKLGKFL